MVSWKPTFGFIFIIRYIINVAPSPAIDLISFISTARYKARARTANVPTYRVQSTTLKQDLMETNPTYGVLAIEKAKTGWWFTWEDTVYADDGQMIHQIIVEDRNVRGKATVKKRDFGIEFSKGQIED